MTVSLCVLQVHFKCCSRSHSTYDLTCVYMCFTCTCVCNVALTQDDLQDFLLWLTASIKIKFQSINRQNPHMLNPLLVTL